MKRKYKEWIVVALAAISVMAVSVVMTWVATNVNPEGEHDSRTLIQRMLNEPIEEEVPSEIPMQAAYAVCRQHIENDVGSALRNISFDNRSSRHNAEERYYQIFVNVYMGNGNDSIYSRCNVSSVTAEILEYRLRADEGFLFRLF
ncbi:hypothetical protein E4656_05705 [Natronospirillum operosum]|uniref:Uncharacterized protein n=1 Tax=Natronospirillum operosum TaxID=2759953 RepID=A0A4Z0WJY4_9GAMM|nr:hypothetical protein [Natronospirillum operosum]TGG95893.1 hypothetical protein E4656_05705 [Natronospirillum operosum]